MDTVYTKTTYQDASVMIADTFINRFGFTNDAAVREAVLLFMYHILPANVLLFIRKSKTRSQISSSSAFSELKTMKYFGGGLRSLITSIEPECSESNITNHGSKSAAWYSK